MESKTGIVNEKFEQQLFYLDPKFKQDLRDFRWKWIVPTRLDRLINPILLRFPLAFDQVLTPCELDEVVTLLEEYSSHVLLFKRSSDIMTIYRLKGQHRGKIELVKAIEFMKKQTNKGQCDEQSIDTCHKQICDFLLNQQNEQAAILKSIDEAALQKRWPKFPMPAITAEMSDLGESIGGLQPPLVVTALKGRLTKRRGKDKTGREHEVFSPFQDNPEISADFRWLRWWFENGNSTMLVRTPMEPSVRKRSLVLAGGIRSDAAEDQGKRQQPGKVCPEDFVVIHRILRWYVVGKKRRVAGQRKRTSDYQEIIQEVNGWKRKNRIKGKGAEKYISSWLDGGRCRRIMIAQKLGIVLKVHRVASEWGVKKKMGD